jgi:glycosyltransferase involved in cell wall biosynthesis
MSRIAFLCTSGLSNASPRGRWMPIARQLARRGHDVTLLMLHPTFDKLAPTERRQAIGDVECRYVAQMHVYGLPGERRFYSAPALLSVSLRAALALFRAASAFKPDIVHCCKPQPINGLAAQWAAKKTGARLFVDCDDLESEANRTGNAYQRAILARSEQRLPAAAAGVTVNTRFLFDYFAALGIPAARMAHVPNGVELARVPRHTRAHDGRTVLYVGTLSTVAHGVGLLLDAFARVLRKAPDARLLMVGDGDERAALTARAASLGIADSVTWTGELAQGDVAAYYARASCSVDPVYDLPAMRGRSPLKIVESLAHGVPIVTAAIGDRRAMLDNGTCGELVTAGDPGALADGIVTLLRDSERNARCSDAARQHAERYDIATLTDIWEGVYKDAGAC